MRLTDLLLGRCLDGLGRYGLLSLNYDRLHPVDAPYSLGIPIAFSFSTVAVGEPRSSFILR